MIGTRDGRNWGGKLERRSLPVVLSRTRALLSSGKLDEVEQACRQILDVDPDNHGALQLLRAVDAAQQPPPSRDLKAATNFHQSGNLTEAERIYRAILRTEPRHFSASYLLGVIFLQQSKFGAAEQQIGRAIKVKPDVAAAHFNRGLALMKLGRLEQALSSFDECIALTPTHDRAALMRDTLLKRLQRAHATPLERRRVDGVGQERRTPA